MSIENVAFEWAFYTFQIPCESCDLCKASRYRAASESSTENKLQLFLNVGESFDKTKSQMKKKYKCLLCFKC